MGAEPRTSEPSDAPPFQNPNEFISRKLLRTSLFKSLSRSHYLGTEDGLNSISSPSALPGGWRWGWSSNPPTPCSVFLLWPIPPLKLSKGSPWVTSLLYTQIEPERSSLWRTKDTCITQKIPRVFEVLCQEPGTKTKYIFYYITVLKCFLGKIPLLQFS